MTRQTSPPSPQRRITHAPFGRLPDGRQATLFTLTNAAGMRATITDYGGIVTALLAPDRAGRMANVVLGCDTLDDYLAGNAYLGALIGRYGNRIARGQFTLDGTRHQLTLNHGVHHLHGGHTGFDKVLWHARIDADTATLVLEYTSVDGEQGYPGTLVTTVAYTLLDTNELVMRVHAVTDRATPVNITQHSYFNLAGQGDILGHALTLHAHAFTPVDDGLIPLGAPVPVTGTPFDFRSSRSIGERIGQPDKQLRHGSGYDHHLVLTGASALAARVLEPVSGRVLELFTDQPGLQFYSGNFLDGTLGFAQRSGFCLEPQHAPDSPNQPGFPDTILRPGAVYRTTSRWRFSCSEEAG